MMQQFVRTSAILAVFVGVITSGARAQTVTVVDQANATSGSTLGLTTTAPQFGQSFTPTLTAINFATFTLSVGSPASYVVNVFAGDGLSGTLLGTSASQALSTSALTSTQFLFATTIPLLPGGVYTLGLQPTVSAVNTLTTAFSFANPYAGGTAYIGTIKNPGNDLVFSEGIIMPATTTTPEPGTWALLGTGLVALGGLARRPRAEAGYSHAE